MILCFQCEDLSNISIKMNRPNIKLIITFCAIWHYQDLRTFARKFSNIDFFLKISPLKDDELVMSKM